MIGWLHPATATSAAPHDDFWYQEVGPKSAAGVPVTHKNALGVSVALACVKTIAEAEGQLPLDMFYRDRSGDKRRAVEHPVYELLHDRPNDEHTAIEWREMMTAWAVMRGTAYSEIVPGRRGAVDQLIPLHPDHMRPVKVTDNSGRTRWQWEHKEPDAPARRLLRDELLILRALGIKPNSPEGLDPIMCEKETLGAALAAQDYANRFFANDARPSGVVEWEGDFKDEESRNVFVRAWRKAFGGKSRHGVAVLTRGMKYHQIGLTHEQAQFLETRSYLDVDICRIFKVQPHKVGILDRATFSNIEEQSIAFVVDTLMPWLVRWEQAIKRDLITARGYFAEHNVAGLLRGDVESRYAAYAIGRNWGWLSANDVLRLENMNGIGPEGDIYLQPMSMARAGEDGEPTRPRNERRPPPEPTDAKAMKMNGHGLYLPEEAH